MGGPMPSVAIAGDLNHNPSLVAMAMAFEFLPEELRVPRHRHGLDAGNGHTI